ncbi:uncharacterized protein PV07_12566 [Cladophialophora immunda]|uniref:F-box domain-containing protein n=1 Tax=Cladophialophora immunda TaxID=569365 RepID=A0A0D2CET8_9EURO|nr:uncharacterized protein PV07_12566 [Cladophialophora immunda]KIW22039.1 hypothetical protein PV07_12566 [Cladophialophora immunda]
MSTLTLTGLPDELIIGIFEFLDSPSVASVCKQLRTIYEDQEEQVISNYFYTHPGWSGEDGVTRLKRVLDYRMNTNLLAALRLFNAINCIDEKALNMSNWIDVRETLEEYGLPLAEGLYRKDHKVESISLLSSLRNAHDWDTFSIRVDALIMQIDNQAEPQVGARKLAASVVNPIGWLTFKKK